MLAAVPTVGVAPVAINDVATTPAGTSILINVTANDDDEGNSTGFFVDAITQVPTTGTGTAVLQANKLQVQYNPPNTIWMGTATFRYSITDYNDGMKATGTVTVNVTAPPPGSNRAPIAVGDTATTARNVAVTITPLPNDSDPDGDPLTLSATLVRAPTSGTATVTTSSNSIRYTPSTNFVGRTSLTYRVLDGRGGDATADVNITVYNPCTVSVCTPFTGAGTCAATTGLCTCATATKGTVSVLVNAGPPRSYTCRFQRLLRRFTGTYFSARLTSSKVAFRFSIGTTPKCYTGVKVISSIVRSSAVTCPSGTPTVLPVVASTVATGETCTASTGLGQYAYAWPTGTVVRSCYRLTLNYADKSPSTIVTVRVVS